MSDKRIIYISMPRDQWAEHMQEAQARLSRALALLRDVEKRRNLFPSPCISCGKLPEPHGPGHAPDCKLAALLEESDE